MEKTRLLAAAIETITEGLTTTGGTAGFGSSPQSTTVLIGSIINAVLGLLGIAGIVFITYAGILYLISQGEKEPIEKAKKILTYTIVGMVIIVAAFAITNYLIGALIIVVG